MAVFFMDKRHAMALANAVERALGFLPKVAEDVVGYYVDVPYCGGKGDMIVDAFQVGFNAAKLPELKTDGREGEL